MKLLLDENLSPRLIDSLSPLYTGSMHVESIDRGRATDGEVWAYAKAKKIAVVSRDSDFVDRSFLELDPPKVTWIRLGNRSTKDVEHLIRSQYEAIRIFLEEDSETCLLPGRYENARRR